MVLNVQWHGIKFMYYKKVDGTLNLLLTLCVTEQNTRNGHCCMLGVDRWKQP